MYRFTSSTAVGLPRERAVSFLPFEQSGNFPVNPRRGFTLQITQEIIQTVFRFQTHQQVSMVVHAVDLQRHRVHTLNDSAEIGMQTRFPFGKNQSTTFLGGKNEMKIRGDIARWHIVGDLIVVSRVSNARVPSVSSAVSPREFDVTIQTLRVWLLSLRVFDARPG